MVEEGLVECGEAVERYAAVDVVEAGAFTAYDLQKVRKSAGTEQQEKQQQEEQQQQQQG
jgi:hypothetical protein